VTAHTPKCLDLGRRTKLWRRNGCRFVSITHRDMCRHSDRLPALQLSTTKAELGRTLTPQTVPECCIFRDRCSALPDRWHRPQPNSQVMVERVEWPNPGRGPMYQPPDFSCVTEQLISPPRPMDYMFPRSPPGRSPASVNSPPGRSPPHINYTHHAEQASGARAKGYSQPDIAPTEDNKLLKRSG
jgi:hypothetical protein